MSEPLYIFGLAVWLFLSCCPLALTHCCCGCVRWQSLGSNTLADYNVRSGSWSISTGSISTSSSNALAIFNAEAISTSHANLCGWTFTAVGDTAKIVGGYLDDNNYIYASVEKIADFGPTPAFNLKLYKREAGVETLLDSTSIIWGPSLGARLCLGDDKLTFSFGGGGTGDGGSVYLLTNGLPYSFGKMAGVGTGTVVGTVTFSLQQFLTHKSDDTTCPACPCATSACPAGTYPKQMELIPLDGPSAGMSFILDQSGDHDGNCEYVGGVGGLAAYVSVPFTASGVTKISVQCTRVCGTVVTVADCLSLGSGTMGGLCGGNGCWSTFTIQGIPGP